VSDRLESGIRAFNEGHYFEAHELWEDVWRASSGSTRTFVQGLVQVAVGLHHLKGGNRRGGLHVLRRGLDKLERAPAECQGIDNGRFIKDIQAYLNGDMTDPIRITPTHFRKT
jgi:predicted metal-dependent hydrolase